MRVEPSELDEVISVTPAMRPSARSSGVATVAAMVSGLAPGSEACTEMVGKSTCGSGETGSRLKAIAPVSAMPSVSSVVATGRSMKGAERFISAQMLTAALAQPLAVSTAAAVLRKRRARAVEGEIDHRRGEQREHLAHQQARPPS